MTFFSALRSLVLISSLITDVNSEECIPKKYNFDSVVCVCNSTYCDTIPKVRAPLKGNYLLFTSSKDGKRFKRSVGSFKQSQTIQGTKLVVDRITTYQNLIGFGAAFTDSAGINILSLKPQTQDLLLKSYFSIDGLEYNLGRVPIGGTDFSTRGYSYSEKQDPTFESFNLTIEDYKYKIPLIKRAQSLSPHSLKLTATCWSPPKWMKTNHAYVGFGTLILDYYLAYATYHVKFLDKYLDEGIKFWCITTGNEPINGLLWFNYINALGWTPQTQKQWIAHFLGPSMRSSHPDTCILAVDDQRYTFPWWLRTIMSDAEAAKYINGSAVHWYWDFIIPSNVLSKTHYMFPDLFMLYTESSNGDKPWDIAKVALGWWKRAENYAADIIASFNNWVVGWIDWNLAVNEQGGPNWVQNYVDAPIIVNKTADEFYKQPMFYALAHFSKFISPESKRIQSTVTPSSTLDATAAQRPDGGIAIVILNKKRYDISLTVVDTVRGSTVIDVPKESINTIFYQ